MHQHLGDLAAVRLVLGSGHDDLHGAEHPATAFVGGHQHDPLATGGAVEGAGPIRLGPISCQGQHEADRRAALHAVDQHVGELGRQARLGLRDAYQWLIVRACSSPLVRPIRAWHRATIFRRTDRGHLRNVGAMSFDVPDPDLTPDQMVARAVALRSRLRDDQAATEANSRYSTDMHQAFTDAGFYRILQPRMFGGYEFNPRTYYRTIIEIARGCPSSGWMLCLGAGHALQLGACFTKEAQAETFGPDGHFVAPLSVGNFPGARPARSVDGGYRVSG
jgi:hypothetical protein